MQVTNVIRWRNWVTCKWVTHYCPGLTKLYRRSFFQFFLNRLFHIVFYDLAQISCLRTRTTKQAPDRTSRRCNYPWKLFIHTRLAHGVRNYENLILNKISCTASSAQYLWVYPQFMCRSHIIPPSIFVSCPITWYYAKLTSLFMPYENVCPEERVDIQIIHIVKNNLTYLHNSSQKNVEDAYLT